MPGQTRVSTRPYVSPRIEDFGSIADHTFGSAGLFGLSGSAQIHCNAGRGNGPEPGPGSSTWIDPHSGGRGPGSSPSGDCDPGNSGGHNAGGD